MHLAFWEGAAPAAWGPCPGLRLPPQEWGLEGGEEEQGLHLGDCKAPALGSQPTEPSVTEVGGVLTPT